MQNLTHERLGRPLAWLARRAPRAARAVTLLPWLVVALGLELLGRTSPADAVDGVGVALLAACGASAALKHKTALLEAWRGERLRRLVAPWKVRFGVDLRGTPPLPARQPRAWVVSLLVLAALLLGLAAAHAGFPTLARDQVRALSGLVWLVLLGGLWLLLGGATLAAWAIAHGFAEARLEARGALTANVSSAVRWILGCALVLTLAGAVALPLAWSLPPILLAGLVHAGLSLPVCWNVRLVWRGAASNMPPAWGRLGVWNAGVVLLLTLLVLIPILFAGGDRLFGPGPPQTAVTALLARGFAWSAATVLPTLLAMEAWSLCAGRWRDPARAIAPLVLYRFAQENVLDAASAKRLARDAEAALEQAGFQARAEDEIEDGRAVRIELDPEALARDPFAAFHGERWPLRVQPEELGDAGLHARLERRALQQARRDLRRGVERLFKYVARHASEAGNGYWFAPHLWYVPALSRDEDDRVASGIGPPYRKLFPHAARAYFQQVLFDLEVDLLFVEDGVGARRLWRVLAMLFEYHDMFGARRLEDERHFSGLPGVRVILHEMDLDTPLHKSGYPEPDYEDLGRARVLHVFRDRGGEEERLLVPDDSGRRPAPAEPVLV